MGNGHSKGAKPGENLALGQGMYKAELYKWSVEQAQKAIAAKKLASPGTFSDERTETENIECGICWKFYSKANLLTCCRGQICTECLTVCIPPPPAKVNCMFCHHANAKTICMDKPQQNDGDDEKFQEYEERRRQGLEDRPIKARTCPVFDLDNEQEARAQNLQQATNGNIEMIRELINAGLQDDEIRMNMTT